MTPLPEGVHAAHLAHPVDVLGGVCLEHQGEVPHENLLGEVGVGVRPHEDEDLGGGVSAGRVRDIAAGVVGHGGGGGDVHGHRLVGVRLVRVQYEVALQGDLHAVTEAPGALV